MAEEKLSNILVKMANAFDETLFALSESELAGQWYWSWDTERSVAWNIYEFSKLLEMHKHRCRRWEEHHNGTCCVVERVAKKYVMPRISEFEAELRSHGCLS